MDDRRVESVVPVVARRVSSGVANRKREKRPLAPEERPKACYAKAVDALSRSSRSRADLGRWLTQREFTAEEIEPVLSKLEALGLLDDLVFARGFARSRLEQRGYGPRRVAAELSRRGVAKPIVDQVLAEHRDDASADARPRIDEVAARRWKSLARLAPEVARRRLHGFLARRGFDGDEISRVLRLVARRDHAED